MLESRGYEEHYDGRKMLEPESMKEHDSNLSNRRDPRELQFMGQYYMS